MSASDTHTALKPRRHRRSLLLAMPVLYGLLAYVMEPDFWQGFVRKHPSVADVPNITHGGDGLPGDPVNLAIYGDATQLRGAMQRAGWYVADRLGLKSDTRIVVDTLDHHAYDDAPVSNLYLFGRAEDIAFEMPIGNSPERRHHVRFWQLPA